MCYFRGNPKFKGVAVTLQDTMHLENMIFCLELHFQLKANSSSLFGLFGCFAGTVTLTICMLVLHQ